MIRSSPETNLSLIRFTVWSSAVHAGTMTVQSFGDGHRGHLWGDVQALLSVAAVLAVLVRASGIELGDEIAGYALANAKRWGILHVIWRQKLYPGIGAPSWTADCESETLNHYDHVHIATDGGGYPTGHETYYTASMSPQPPP